MGFFRKIGNALARFMYGRNGLDQLGFTCIWGAIVLDLINLFVKNAVLYRIFGTLSMLLAVWTIFRMLSRNLPKRREENGWYLNRVIYPLKNRRARRQDKEHKYFTCPNCRTVCRVPRGKGRIVITCPKCGGTIHGKS